MNKKLIILYHFLKTKLIKKLPRSILKLWQKYHLNKMLRYAKKHSMFYRKNTNRIIDKKIMMENFSSFNTKGIGQKEAFNKAFNAEKKRHFDCQIDKITVGLSSGTSGNRGLFLVSENERLAWCGSILSKILPGALWKKQKVALFLRASSLLYQTVESTRLTFAYFDLLKDLETLKKELKSFDPDVLVAPPSVLLMLIGCSKPKRVICVAEKLNLSDEIHLEKGYGVKIHQIYQATEGFLGFTCSHGTIHLNEDLLIIEKEYLDDKRFIPIITDLFRKTQPIIRYRLDDILVEKKSSCPCGLHFLALEQIEGRSNDVLYVKNLQGSYKPLFADFIARRITFTDENIQEYEVVQTACDELCIYLDEPYRAKVLDALKQLFKEIDAITPKITFKKPKVRLNLDQKLRRIRRECEAL